MTTHIVKQGDCLLSIADKYGFSSYETIYLHPDNAAFKKLRSDPTTIMPGDKIVIPDKKPSSIKLKPDNMYNLIVTTPKAYFITELLDSAGEPIANAKYGLKIKGIEQPFNGQTDGSGKIEVKIPANAENGVLIVQPDSAEPEYQLRFEVKLGHLDPANTISGQQGRLANKSIYTGALDGEAGPISESAMSNFQLTINADAVGELTEDQFNQISK